MLRRARCSLGSGVMNPNLRIISSRLITRASVHSPLPRSTTISSSGFNSASNSDSPKTIPFVTANTCIRSFTSTRSATTSAIQCSISLIKPLGARWLTLALNHAQYRAYSNKYHSFEEAIEAEKQELQRERRFTRALLKLATLAALLIVGFMIYQDEAWCRFLRSFFTVLGIFNEYTRFVLKIKQKDAPTPEDEEEFKALHRKCAERLASAFLKNGGIYIKIGQYLASMNHLLPAEYTECLEKCQDRAPYTDYKAIRKLFRAEFGNDPEHFFSEFDHTPFASASLAQVHRARLKETGELVAVKLQYPGLRSRLDGDIMVASFLAHMTQRIMQRVDLSFILKHFVMNLKQEINFVQEAKNCERMAAMFKNRPDVSAPRIHWNLTSPRVITMEYIDGVKITDTEGLKRINADPKEVLRILNEVLGEQMFVHGFVHADPHPGNILIRRTNDKSGGIQVVLIDHGLYNTLSDDFRQDYCKLWMATVKGNEEELESYSRRFEVPQHLHRLFAMLLTSRAWNVETNTGFVKQMTPAEAKFMKDFSLNNFINISRLLSEVPIEMFLLLKCNDLLRSLQHQLAPTFDTLRIRSQFAVRGLYKDVYLNTQGVSFSRRMEALKQEWSLRYFLSFYACYYWILSLLHKGQQQKREEEIYASYMLAPMIEPPPRPSNAKQFRQL